MIDWFWYYVGTLAGPFAILVVLWGFHKLKIIKVEFKISYGDRFKP